MTEPNFIGMGLTYNRYPNFSPFLLRGESLTLTQVPYPFQPYFH